jgi:hypothetical protein
VPDLDDQIDQLYAGPLADFTASRNALAKTVGGADAARIKKLEKPTVVAWALNQIYWHARKTFDRVLETGERLRHAQIGALQGKAVDLRGASSAHRDAIAAAVREAERLAGATGSHPSPDALTRTLEALSLLPEAPSAPGRLTGELQPAGFEALSGIAPAAVRHAPAKLPHAVPKSHARPAPVHAASEAARRAAEARRQAEEAKRLEDEARERAAAARKREIEIHKAEAALARAQGAERMAHDAWLRAQKEVDEARQRLTRAKQRG